MDASMEELWRNFKLSKEEKGVTTVEASKVTGSKQQEQYSILFKLQTNKEFNKKAFKATCGDLWRFNQGVTIREVGQTYLLLFLVREII